LYRNIQIDFETFLVLSKQIGLDMSQETHLRELFPEVQAMFERINLVGKSETNHIGLGSMTELVDDNDRK